MSYRAAAGIIGGLFLACETQADLLFLPESRQQQHQTYALFTENQSDLLYRSGKRAWGAIGGGIALVDFSNWAGKPQLVMHGSANAGFRLNDRMDTLLTETVDARVGLSLLFELT